MKRLIGLIAFLAVVLLTTQPSLTPKARAGWSGFGGPGSFADTLPVLLLNPTGPALGCSSPASSLPAGTVACVAKTQPIGGGADIEVPCVASMVDDSVVLMTCTAGPSVVQTGGSTVVQSAASAAPGGKLPPTSPSQQQSLTVPAIIDSHVSLSSTCGAALLGCTSCDGSLAGDTPTDQLASQLCGIITAWNQVSLRFGQQTAATQDVCKQLDDLENLVNAQVQQNALSADGASLLITGPRPSGNLNAGTWGGIHFWQSAQRLGPCPRSGADEGVGSP